MKKIMIYFLLLALPAISFCQKINDSVPVVKPDYLAKSKSQKTAAWVLLGGGTVLMGTAVLIGSGQNASFGDAGTGVVLGDIGFLATIGSIPLFIASGKNKRKANNITGKIKMKNATFFQNQSFVEKPFPAFSAKFSL